MNTILSHILFGVIPGLVIGFWILGRLWPEDFREFEKLSKFTDRLIRCWKGEK